MDNIRVAIYIRVSTHYQVDKDSLPMQREDLANYCKYIFNTDDYEIFEDAGYSGKDTGRPAFQEMMLKVRRKEFTHILVWKIDRISRNLLDFSTMYEELKKYNVTFVSKNEQFDTSTAMGEAMLKIILVFAELERKLTSERVSATMMSRAVKGLWNGANVPLGYKWDAENKYPTPDAEEKQVVNLIYNKYLEIKSCEKLSRFLNNNAVKTKRGGYWTSKTVSDILRNPFYKGTYRYNYRESGRGKKKPESEWIIVENNHKAIISEELWTSCNKILDMNSDASALKFRKNKFSHIFSKKLVCDKCGNGFIAAKDRQRANGYTPSRYRCSGIRKGICNAKIVSDVSIGPFIFELLRNVITALNKYVETLDELEEMLLSGTPFENVLSINREDLELFYIAMYKAQIKQNKLEINTFQKDDENEKSKEEVFTIKINKYKKQKLKYTNALSRLEELYLFSEESMDKADYIIKKTQIEDKIKEAEENLKEFYKIHDEARNIKDMSFIMNYEKFLFNDMFNKTEFNFRKLAENINNHVLQDLVDSVISSIKINEGEISAVYFNNGLLLRFQR